MRPGVGAGIGNQHSIVFPTAIEPGGFKIFDAKNGSGRGWARLGRAVSLRFLDFLNLWGSIIDRYGTPQIQEN